MTDGVSPTPRAWSTAVGFLAGTVEKDENKWVFKDKTAGSSSPLSVDHYYFPSISIAFSRGGRRTAAGGFATASRPSTVAELGPEWNANFALGWVAWHVRQGIDRSWKCVEIQIDTDAATEAIVVAA